MLTKLRKSHSRSASVMEIVETGCNSIMHEHGIGHTEAFYEKALSHYLYDRCIPFLTQVDCFVQKGSAQINVGRIDMEVSHNIILEFKVGSSVKPQDVHQLQKYIRARKACGIDISNAAVICFRTDGSVEVHKFTF